MQGTVHRHIISRRTMGSDITSLLSGGKIGKPKLDKKSSVDKEKASQSFPARWRTTGSHLVFNVPPAGVIKEKIGQATKIRVSAFDMDGTLINTKSGLTFSRGPSDWKWLNDNVKTKIREQATQESTIVVIFTNQAAMVTAPKGGQKSKSQQNFQEKVNQLMASLTSLDPALDSIMFFAAAGRPSAKNKLRSSEELHRIMRKPEIGMWNQLMQYLTTVLGEDITIDSANSVFVGDAAGEIGDFLDSDKKFAENIGIPFKVAYRYFA